jgi:hypothetical protein
LASQPPNTAATAYTVTLNVSSFTNSFRTIINNASDKYIYLDLSGSTMTSIPDRLLNTGDIFNISCTNLIGVKIPNTVTSIGPYAFINNSSLASIIIGNSVGSIGDGIFRDCSSLAYITIPASVTSIGQEAFRNCSSLTRITFQGTIASVNSLAFYGSYSWSILKILTINYQNTIKQLNKLSLL